MLYKSVYMRTTADRIRHTLLFETIAIVSTTAITVLILNKPVATMGALAIAISVMAMLCNYLYNLVFDHWRMRRGESSPNQRSTPIRVLHAIGFELSFIVLTLPLIAWWLELSLWQALLLDIGFAVFFIAYAFVYNWAYDRIFPVPIQD